MKVKQCKDCLAEGVTTQREAKFPGPRCFTHHRAFRAAQKQRSHESMVKKTYGLDDGDYRRLYEFQGGKCWICRRATGRVKRLAVDHNHATGEVRGLLCGVCNRLVGHLRDDPQVAYRIAAYLLLPPAREALLDPKAHVQVLSDEA